MKNKILKLIERDPRMSLESMAERVGAGKEEVAAAIAEMEADGIICGYSAIIDWDKVSNEKVNALIEVKVVPQRGTGFDKIANRIAKFDEVDSVFLISGGYDFAVQIKGRSMREISQFVFEKLSALETVQSTSTHFVLKKYKDHGIIFGAPSSDVRETVIL